MSKKKKTWIAAIGLILLNIGFGLHSSGKTTIEKFEGEQLTVHSIKTFMSNVHVVETGNKVVLIDSGDPSELENIEKALDEINLDIDLIILTHGHEDHVGNAKYFSKKYNAIVIGGIGDKDLFEKGISDELCPTGTMGRIVKAFPQASFEHFIPDIYLDKEYDLRTHGINGEIVPLQDHTKGSLVIKIENCLFVGDMIRGKAMNHSKPTAHFFHCDLARNKANIISMLETYGCNAWFTGHFGPLERKDINEYIKSAK